MQKKHVLIVLCLCCQFISAQDAFHTNLLEQISSDFNLSGGEWVLTNLEDENVNNTITYGNINSTVLTSTNTSFTKYHSIDVLSKGNDPWESGLNIRNQKTVRVNDVVLVSFWARGSDGAEVNFFAENGTTFNKEIFFKLSLEEEWKQYFIGFKTSETLNAGQMAIGLHLAFNVQHVDFAGLALINYENTYEENDLPNSFKDQLYEGAEEDAAWRADAQERIDQYRRSEVRLKLTQGDEGLVVKNWPVKVRMKKHDFEFGSAVVSSRFADNGSHSDIYEEKILNLDGEGHGFNTVVFENSLKWRAWEGNWPANQAEKKKAISWLSEKDITIRGHNLLWPGWNFLPADMEENKENADYLKNRILDHFESLLDVPEVKNHIMDWDVINEITEVRDLEAALQNKLGYTTGREIYAELFKKVKEINPDITCYLNDYISISRDVESGERYDEFKQYIQEILNAGGQIDGIGFQAHIPSSMPGPEKVYRILDDFYRTFGLEMKITEYDIDDFVSDEVAARYMSDFLTIVYSHPLVKGFLTWGFWDGAHWKDNAPFFYRDWTLKPSGQSFIDKVYGEWWTDLDVTSDEEGYIQFEGYHGSYDIIVDDLGSQSFFFQGDTTATIVLNEVVSSTESEFDNVFKIAPNPTIDYIHVNGINREAFSYKLANINGQVLYIAPEATSHTIDMTARPPGTYILSIRSNKETFSKKLVKQ